MKAEPGIAEVLNTCREYRAYCPEPVHTLRDLAHLVSRLVPMMGVDDPVYRDAVRHMGAASAITVVLCILERLPTIANPGGYLRRLTQKARGGGFSTRPILDAIAAARKLSADNPVYQ